MAMRRVACEPGTLQGPANAGEGTQNAVGMDSRHPRIFVWEGRHPQYTGPFHISQYQNAPPTCPQANPMEATSQLKLLFPGDTSLCHDKTKEHTDLGSLRIPSDLSSGSPRPLRGI